MVDTRGAAVRPGRLCRAVLLLLVVAGAAGCGEKTSAGKDFRVSNQQDAFQFQVAEVKHYSHTYTYAWANSGATATVNQSSTITEGAATLFLRDGNGETVYAKSLKTNGTFLTEAGVPGTWTVDVLFDDVSGTVNFRAQKL
ncbi:MAG TPA: hypothetical protein VFT32_08875 [Candidatus Eisenbacteria bacterium]|nr:hypothetical protein [Candidatus Eisenbacteria bacterium]